MYKLITSTVLDDKWQSRPDVLHMPLLQISYVDQLPELNKDSYEDVIITSRHAYIALQNFSAQNFLQNKRIVVVGEHTSLLISPLFPVALKFDNVTALVDYYRFLPSRKVLYLRGQIIKKDLLALLDKHVVQEQIVYSAALLPSIDSEITAKLQSGDITDIFVYSSRAASHLLNLARQQYINRVFSGHIKIHFLSDTMAKEFRFLPNYKVIS